MLDRARNIFALPPAEEDEGQEELELTIVEHLEELRDRIIKILLGLVLCTMVAFVFTPQIYELLKRPAPPGTNLIATEMTEIFFNYFKVALFSGATVAMPWIIYHLIRFIAPGLTRREKAILFRMLPFMAILFLIGVAFGYFFTVPFAAGYLLTFNTDFATPMIKIGNYISFVTTLLFAMGLGFQTPVIVFTLTKLNLVSTKQLQSYRKYAILIIFVLAAVITPTPDPLNQAMIAIPLFLLYELGILISRLTSP